MISAQIPEKITYVCQQSTPVEPKFNEVEESFFKTSAMPAFPVDSSNEKTLETARSWASGWNRYHQNHNSDVHKEVEMDNTEIFELQIVDLEVRDQGGRAYKAIVHGSFLVDIREDVMLEAMLVKGVRQGSFIACKFIWARIGAQMKLIRVGSSLHKAVLEANERRKLKKVSAKDLVPGKIYNNTTGNYLFLGFVKAAGIKTEYRRPNNSFLSITRTEGKYVPVAKEKPAKKQLWYSIYDHQDLEPIKDGTFDILKTDSDYRFDFTKSKTVLPADLPEVKLQVNHLELIRQHQYKLKSTQAVNYFQLITFAKYPSKELKLTEVTQKLWDNLEFTT